VTGGTAAQSRSHCTYTEREERLAFKRLQAGDDSQGRETDLEVLFLPGIHPVTEKEVESFVHFNDILGSSPHERLDLERDLWVIEPLGKMDSDGRVLPPSSLEDFRPLSLRHGRQKSKRSALSCYKTLKPKILTVERSVPAV
jgi:hypothetical protein